MRVGRTVILAVLGVGAVVAPSLEALAQQRRGPVEFTIRRPHDNNLPGVRGFGDGGPPQPAPNPGHYARRDLEPFWYTPGPPRHADPRGWVDGWHGMISPGATVP